jgi:hypothetical protein
MDLIDKERRVEDILRSDSPPTQALGPTTDYRQIALAWARAHDLDFEEFIQRLDNAGGMEPQRLVDEIRRDPAVEAIIREALTEPVAGDEPAATRYAALEEDASADETAEPAV